MSGVVYAVFTAGGPRGPGGGVKITRTVGVLGACWLLLARGEVPGFGGRYEYLRNQEVTRTQLSLRVASCARRSAPRLRLLISRCARLARLCHLHSHRSSVVRAFFARRVRCRSIHVCACGSLGGRLRVERALTAGVRSTW